MRTTAELREYCLQQIENGIQSGSRLIDDWSDLYGVAVLRELEEFAKSGELDRRAKLEGKPENVVMLEASRGLEEPLERLQQVRERTWQRDQNRLKAEIQEYAREHGISIPEASARVNDGRR